jgi:DNA (cytosine-5)-methyltransferase 1
MNYYNDNDPNAAAWLRELIKCNLIPAGDVDERSIADVTKADLKGYIQCHFFAGIGGWSEALRLAGWPTTRPVWTGSCPCQPFSSAGKRKGTADERHLWPEFYRLIRECRPVTVFGEQVERAIGLGWLDGVFADLEAENYTCGAAVLGAHSVNAPHIRQRLYWVAESSIEGSGGLPIQPGGSQQTGFNPIRNGETSGLADSEDERCERGGRTRTRRERFENNCTNGGMDDTNCRGCGEKREFERLYEIRERGANEWMQTEGAGPFGFWSNSILIPCKDGKARRISPEPAFFPLADGLPGRVAMLRGFGNAIVPQVAAEFIKAYMEVTNDLS